MPFEKATQERAARVIVVGNEKGGSGKSTVAMHIAVALIKSGHSVATIRSRFKPKELHPLYRE